MKDHFAVDFICDTLQDDHNPRDPQISRGRHAKEPEKHHHEAVSSAGVLPTRRRPSALGIVAAVLGSSRPWARSSRRSAGRDDRLGPGRHLPCVFSFLIGPMAVRLKEVIAEALTRSSSRQLSPRRQRARDLRRDRCSVLGRPAQLPELEEASAIPRSLDDRAAAGAHAGQACTSRLP